MRRGPRRRLPALTLALALAAAPAGAASLALDDRARQEALRVGQRSVTADDFGDEWRVTNAAGHAVTVVTPFHRLALAARHAAFRNEPLTQADQDRALAEVRDRLAFWVTLPGPRPDFARHLRPRLVADGREIEPTLVQNERTAVRQEDGRYLARCTYWFPTTDLSPTARLDLVVRDLQTAEPVTRFAIDLGRMR